VLTALEAAKGEGGLAEQAAAVTPVAPLGSEGMSVDGLLELEFGVALKQLDQHGRRLRRLFGA
jgi:hypothetical protein